MYPQTYGTRYYGRRFPIEIEKQLSASAEGFAFLEYTKIITLYLIAAAEGTAKFLPKLVSKKIMGEVEGMAAIVKKVASFSLSAVCEAGAKVAKTCFINLYATTMGAVVKTIPSHYIGAIYGGSSYGVFYGARTVFYSVEEITKRVILAPKTAISKTTAKFLSRIISKNISAIAEGTAIIKKAISFSLTAASEVGANITKHVIFIPIFATCEAGAAIKKQMQKALQAIAEGLALIRKYRQFDFEFIGPFTPGDVVTINSRTLEVTLNGENALHLVGKDEFPKILPGEQILIFTDAEDSRTVRVKIRWKDRWL